jgi:hypothetical protein
MADDLASAVTASIQGRGAEFRFGDSPKPEQRTDYEGPDAPQIRSPGFTPRSISAIGDISRPKRRFCPGRNGL